MEPTSRAIQKVDDPLYLSGPMSGEYLYNFETFNRAASQLRAIGYKVINPAEYGSEDDEGKPWAYYILRDLKDVANKARGIVLLKDWQKSRGARLENQFAQELGLPRYQLNEEGVLNPYREPSILVEAEKIVGSDRQLQYGHPSNDFARTADMWTGLFRDKLAKHNIFYPEDVAKAQICLKLSREMNLHKRDNLVDIAGYAKCLEMIWDKRNRQWEDNFFTEMGQASART